MMFSIITVSYNCEETVAATIESVLSQKGAEFEYLIIDGSSTDGTLEIIKKYASENSLIRWVSEPDRGIYHAMNKGIGMARGELINLLNADDQLAPDSLPKLREGYRRKNEVGIYYGDALVFETMNISFEKRATLEAWKGVSICHQAMFVHRKVYESIGLYNERYFLGADYDFFLRCLEKKVRFFPVGGVVVHYHNTGRSVQHPFKSMNEKWLVALKNFGAFRIDLFKHSCVYFKSLFFLLTERGLIFFLGREIARKIRAWYLKKYYI